MSSPVKPVLVFTWGNPSRGDDAIGPLIHDRLQAGGFTHCNVLTDFQLQIEHAIDLEDRKRVLFVDASVSVPAPFGFSKLRAEPDSSYTTHAMSPASLLAVFKQVNGQEPPPSFLLSVRGYEFGLGAPVSGAANRNTALAFSFIEELLEHGSTEEWLLRIR